MNITLKHLRAFVEVAREGSFTRAAQRLLISQPALTSVVAQFEAEVGLKLFERTTRRVRLTEEGMGFLPIAERLLEDVDQAVEALKENARGRSHRLAIAALPSVATQLLPPVLALFHARCPEVRIHLLTANASGVQSKVRQGEVDFGIGSRWQADPELAFEVITRDSFGAVLPADHPLAAAGEPLPWRALESYPVIGMARDTGIWALLYHVETLPRSVRQPQFEVSTLSALSGLLDSRLGLAALPALALPANGRVPLRIRPLNEPTLEREISVITRRSRTPAPPAQVMLDLLRSETPATWPREADKSLLRIN